MRSLAVVLLLFVLSTGFAQKKKEIKKYGIRLITVNETTQGKTIPDSKSGFDSNGNLVEEVKYNKEGALKSTVRYKYNKSGDVIEESEYDEKNNLKEKRMTKYDALGQKTEELTINAAGVQIKKEVFVYDSRGLKIEKRIYDSTNNLITTKKTFYSKGE